MRDRWVLTVKVDDVQIEVFKLAKGYAARTRLQNGPEAYGITEKQAVYLCAREIPIEIGKKVTIRLEKLETEVQTSMIVSYDHTWLWWSAYTVDSTGHSFEATSSDLGSAAAIGIVESLGRNLNNARQK